jgi:hypothetical protein
MATAAGSRRDDARQVIIINVMPPRTRRDLVETYDATGGSCVTQAQAIERAARRGEELGPLAVPQYAQRGDLLLFRCSAGAYSRLRRIAARLRHDAWDPGERRDLLDLCDAEANASLGRLSRVFAWATIVADPVERRGSHCADVGRPTLMGDGVGVSVTTLPYTGRAISQFQGATRLSTEEWGSLCDSHPQLRALGALAGDAQGRG